MIAYKLLREGAVGPFSGFAWPTSWDGSPGAWVEASPSPCASGVHACRQQDVPFWLLPELWEIELDGPLLELPHSVVAPRGRLVRLVESWDDDARRAFCESCLEAGRAAAAVSPRAASVIPNLESALARVAPGVAGLVAAHAADLAGPPGSEAERLRQSRWLTERLGLEGDL